MMALRCSGSAFTKPQVKRSITRQSQRPRTVVKALPFDTSAFSAQLISTLAEASEYPERTGTVDAPIEYAVGLGIVVAIAGTLAVPLFLKPGQEAADAIAQGKNPNADKMKGAVKGVTIKKSK